MADIIWLQKVYDDGWHNAFTDLEYWKGEYYLSFRNGLRHASPDGKTMVLKSKDLKHWNSVAVPTNTLGDDRDPHLVSTETRLYLYSGSWMLREDKREEITSVPQRDQPGGTEYFDVWSFCSYTDDGTNWSEPVCLYKRNYWLWKPVRIGDVFYCVSELCGVEKENKDDWSVELLHSTDGLQWESLSTVVDHDVPNETAVRMKTDNTIQLIIRAEGAGVGTLIGESMPPYRKWEIHPIDAAIQSPEIVEMEDAVYLGGRSRNGESRMSIWRLQDHEVQPVVQLPSGGDCAYPGMLAQEDGTILVSYYSQHEVPLERRQHMRKGINTADIYLACVKP